MDGNEVPILNVNGCAMGIAFIRGKHHVILEYTLPDLSWLRALSWLAFLLALVLLVMVSRTGTGRIAGIVGVAVIAGMAGWGFFGHDPTSEPSTTARVTLPDTEGTVLHLDNFDPPVGSDTINFQSDSVPGSMLALVKGRSDWSPAFEVELDDLRAGYEDALMIETSFQWVPIRDSTGATYPFESFVVLSVEENGQFGFYRTQPLHRSWIQGEWSKACLIAQVEQLKRCKGKLKAYVWNNGPGIVLLDDFRVSVMPWDSLGVTY